MGELGQPRIVLRWNTEDQNRYRVTCDPWKKLRNKTFFPDGVYSERFGPLQCWGLSKTNRKNGSVMWHVKIQRCRAAPVLLANRNEALFKWGRLGMLKWFYLLNAFVNSRKWNDDVSMASYRRFQSMNFNDNSYFQSQFSSGVLNEFYLIFLAVFGAGLVRFYATGAGWVGVQTRRRHNRNGPFGPALVDRRDWRPSRPLPRHLCRPLSHVKKDSPKGEKHEAKETTIKQKHKITKMNHPHI